MLRGTAEVAYLSGNAEPRVRTMGAGPGTFFSVFTPETFTYLWRFQTLNGPTDFGFSFKGWEDVNGHRCAHIEFNTNPSRPARVLKELWVDLERGAHPLRIKNTDGDNTVYLIDQIQLSQFKLPDGQDIWFPVGGTMTQYHHRGKYLREPAYRTTSHVLNGTIVFNQGLGDGVFHVKGDPFRPSFQAKALAPAASARKTAPVDHAQVERALDEALADPERKARERDAAAATQDELNAWLLVTWAVGLAAVAALLGAGWMAIRASRA